MAIWNFIKLTLMALWFNKCTHKKTSECHSHHYFRSLLLKFVALWMFETNLRVISWPEMLSLAHTLVYHDFLSFCFMIEAYHHGINGLIENNTFLLLFALDITNRQKVYFLMTYIVWYNGVQHQCGNPSFQGCQRLK